MNAGATGLLARAGYSTPQIGEIKREGWWWAKNHVQAARRGNLWMFSGLGIVWTRPGHAELVEIEALPPGPGEVTVEVLASFVNTGTERAQFLRLPHSAISTPFRPGLSAAGRVLDASRSGGRFAEGQLVAVRRARHGSIATVPMSSVVPVPDGVSTSAASLVQLGVICERGVSLARVETGDPAVVVGAGIIGSLTQRILMAEGCGPITVLATSQRKARSVDAGGAKLMVAASPDDPAVAELRAPLVIEATGDPDAVRLALRAAGDGGRVILLGSARGITRGLDLGLLRERRARLVGAHVDTLAMASSQTGDDLGSHVAAAFLSRLADGIAVDDLVGTALDPAACGSFYRELGEGASVTGAYFDWERFSRSVRVRRRSVARPPRLGFRGLRAERPVAAAGRGGLFKVEDPFASAEGSFGIGLLGCGDIARASAPAIASAPNASLTACFDPVPRLAAEVASAHGARVCSSAEELMERDDVDAVFIAVPHHLHAPLTVAAAERGCHVMVEKPLAESLTAAQEMVAACERAGVALSVCFPRRYSPAAIVARRLVEAGALGTPRGLAIRYLVDKPLTYWSGGFSARAHGDWRGDRARSGGGVLLMNMSHHLDLARFVWRLETTGVVGVTAVGPSGGDVENSVSLSLELEGGAIGNVLGMDSLRGAEPFEEVLLWGSRGTIALESDPRVFTTAGLPGLRSGRWTSLDQGSPRNERAAFVSRFVTCASSGEKVDITALDGLAVQGTIDAAYRSVIENVEQGHPDWMSAGNDDG